MGLRTNDPGAKARAAGFALVFNITPVSVNKTFPFALRSEGYFFPDMVLSCGG